MLTLKILLIYMYKCEDTFKILSFSAECLHLYSSIRVERLYTLGVNFAFFNIQIWSQISSFDPENICCVSLYHYQKCILFKECIAAVFSN